MRAIGWLRFALTGVVWGCGPNVPSTMPSSAPPKCADGAAWREALGSLKARDVLDVEPTYLVDTCSGTAKITGTRVRVHATGRAQDDPLSRVLGCVGARAYVRVPEPPRAEPAQFALPDGPLEIEVEASGGDVAITLHSGSVRENIALFRRLAQWSAACRRSPSGCS
jgi:hypothetical protein